VPKAKRCMSAGNKNKKQNITRTKNKKWYICMNHRHILTNSFYSFENVEENRDLFFEKGELICIQDCPQYVA